MTGDKILYILNRFPQTSQTFIVDEICALQHAGFHIDILAAEIQIELFDRFPQLDPRSFVGVRQMEKFRRFVDTNVAVDRFVNRLSLRNKFRVFGLRRTEYAAFISHFGPSVILAAGVKRRFFSKARLIGVFHGYDMSSYVTKRGFTAYERALPYIDVLMPISELWATRLKEAGFPSDKIQMSRLGMDIDKLAALASDAAPVRRARPYHIVSVGRLVEKKGFDVLLRALGQLGPDFVRDNFRIEIIGSGVERHKLEALAAELGVAEFVAFAGSLSRPEVVRRMKASDVFVLASRTAADGDMEGLPVVLMEAMALKVPIISTFHSGIPELIEDGRTGRLVPEGDDAALAEVLRTFAADPAPFRRMVDPAYTVVASDFSADKHIADLIAAIRGSASTMVEADRALARA